MPPLATVEKHRGEGQSMTAVGHSSAAVQITEYCAGAAAVLVSARLKLYSDCQQKQSRLFVAIEACVMPCCTTMN